MLQVVSSKKQEIELKDKLRNVDLSGIHIASSVIHPKAEFVFKFTQQIVTEELGPEFEVNKDMAEFVFYVFPLIQNNEIAMCVLIYDVMLFLLDDYMDKFPNEHAKWICYHEIKDFSGTGHIEKWFQLFMKVGEKILGKAAHHLIELSLFCQSKFLELQIMWSGKTLLTDKEYVDLRIIDCGSQHQFFLVLLGAGVQLTDELKNDPNYIGLNRHAAIHVGLINDLYSLRKEIERETYKQNYVYIKVKNGNMTAQSAVNEIIVEILEADRMAHVYGENLKEATYPNISNYVLGMYAAMTGNHFWSTICRRYNKRRNA